MTLAENLRDIRMSTLTKSRMNRLARSVTVAAPSAADLRQEPCFVAAALVEKGRFWRLVRFWALGLRSPLHYLDSPAAKRFTDIVGSAFLLVLLLPLFAVVALLIKLKDGGPVLFWQIRVGRWGREFALPKFRSMVSNAEELLPTLLALNDHKEGVVFKMKTDPRVTWIGRIIRKFSIDEMPQLWSVLKGDMSLVGPRPPVPWEVARYTLYDRRRLDVLPGLTCIWQVSGRSLIPFPKQVEMDVEYIQKQSFWLDLKLILLTIPAVLFPKGAY
jgi:lipopolysaccharide/colanic/teichoic acid biosynthesis glycosyltransferase